MHNNNRKKFIDILKGMGILLVVSGHIYGPLMSWALPCYVPLFFVASGYCTNKTVKIKGKFQKLIIPYFIFSFILLVLSGHPIDIKDILGILYSRWCLYPLRCDNNIFLLRFGNGPLWFLTSMFVAYIFFMIIQQSNKRIWILTLYFTLTYILSFLPILLPWSIDTAFLMAIFIYCGTQIREKNLLQKINRKCFLVIILLYILLMIFWGNINLSVRIYGRSLIILLVSAIIGSLILMKISQILENCHIGKKLELIGKHSLSIFCLHIPFINIWKDLTIIEHTNIPPTIDGILCVIFVISVTYPLSLLLDKYVLRLIIR